MISVTTDRHNDVQRAVVVLIRRDTEVGRWPFLTDDHLDLSAIDDLARTQLAAQRLGCSIRLEDVCPSLLGLLELVGLRVEVGG
jgi:hypothetical protein